MSDNISSKEAQKTKNTLEMLSLYLCWYEIWWFEKIWIIMGGCRLKKHIFTSF